MKVSGLASLYGNMRPNCSNELAEFMLGQILLPIIVCRCKVSSGRRFPRDLSTATMPELYAGGNARPNFTLTLFGCSSNVKRDVD